MKLVFELHPGEERAVRLAEADPRLGRLIAAIGKLEVHGRGEQEFEFLVRSLIGQQLSAKAAATICERVVSASGGITPETMRSVAEEVLRDCGVSGPKIRYLKGLAEAEGRGELDWSSLRHMDEEEAIRFLTRHKGVGRWTAEMFLIFVLGRPDVLSLGDAGLRRSVRWLYAGYGGNGETPALEQLGEKWKPFRSIASLYLWEAVNRGLVNGRE